MFRRTRGDSRLPPLVFLHGFLGTSEDWEEMLPFFEERYYCIAYDLPDKDLVAAVKKEVEKISPKPILIGYSMGGRIALQLQEHAAAVVALSANPGLKSEKEKEVRRKADEEWAQKMEGRPWRVFLDEWYGQSIFASLHGKPLLQTIIEKRMKAGPGGNANVMREMSLANQMAVEEFSVPTLMMYGEEDWKFRDLYSTLPRGHFQNGVDKRLCEAKTDQSERSSRFECCNHLVDGCRSQQATRPEETRTFLNTKDPERELICQSRSQPVVGTILKMAPKHVCVRGIKNSGHCLNQENPADCATEILKWINHVHGHSLSEMGRDRQDHHQPA